MRAKHIESFARCVATGVALIAVLSGCKGRSKEATESEMAQGASGGEAATASESKEDGGGTEGTTRNTGAVVAAKPPAPRDGRVEPRFKAPGEPELVPTRVARLLARNQKARARNAALRRLGRDLSASEVDALCAFLNRKNSQDAMPPDQLNALKDSVAKKLEQQRRRPANYAKYLMAMHYDQGHDVVWRDYCVQHLGTKYSQGQPLTNNKRA